MNLIRLATQQGEAEVVQVEEAVVVQEEDAMIIEVWTEVRLPMASS